MKRLFGLVVLGLGVLVLSACPIYESRACFDASDCRIGEYCGGDGTCHVLPDDSKGFCRGPGDCGANQTCGADHLCHPGDCSAPGTGCLTGYECVESAAGPVCRPRSDAGLPDAGGDGGEPGEAFCGSPSDCAPGTTCSVDGRCHAGDCGTHPCINGFVCVAGEAGPACVRGNPAGCGSDDDCGASRFCVDGLCTEASFLCSDGSQCATGRACVDGRCVVRCKDNEPCHEGFLCNERLGVCLHTESACSRTEDCESASRVCVAGACVPRCGKGGACELGAICVDNGCVPKAGKVVECDLDGERDACDEGRICLRHHCYLSCEAPKESRCAAEPVASSCKATTTSSGTHAVCGSLDSLGEECDFAMGQRCSGTEICIDGSCQSPSYAPPP